MDTSHAAVSTPSHWDDGGASRVGGEGASSQGHLANADESLISIEAKLRAALEARANTPAPSALRNLLPEPAPSPGRQTPQPGAFVRTGAMGDVLVRGKKERSKVKKVRTGTLEVPRHVQQSTEQSPSAILRRHQHDQLQALLAARRAGGRSVGLPPLKPAAGARRPPVTVAGFTVVHSKP